MRRLNNVKSRRGIRYSIEEKETAIARMMPPYNESVQRLSEELGISDATLYTWRKDARKAGNATPGNGKTSEKWSSEDRFLIVLETYAMNEAELAEYCRKKGLYKEQIEGWKKTSITAHDRDLSQSKQLNYELREERIKSKTLEKELQKKEKALAKATSLLLLRKKAQAIWGDEGGE